MINSVMIFTSLPSHPSNKYNLFVSLATKSTKPKAHRLMKGFLETINDRIFFFQNDISVNEDSRLNNTDVYMYTEYILKII